MPAIPALLPRRAPLKPLAVPATLMAFMLALAACTTTTTPPQPVTAIAVDAGGTARLISGYRAQHGLGPVTVDSRLMQIAKDYARVMGERDTIKHGLGASLPRRAGGVGYDWDFLAENLAASYSTIGDAMQGWKESAGHNKNLLSPHAREIGIAAVATPAGSDHRNYWALVLGAPRSDGLVAGTFGGGR